MQTLYSSCLKKKKLALTEALEILEDFDSFTLNEVKDLLTKAKQIFVFSNNKKRIIIIAKLYLFLKKKNFSKSSIKNITGF